MHPPCPANTCLRWTADGELDSDDLQQVLARLAAVERGGIRGGRQRGASLAPPRGKDQ